MDFEKIYADFEAARAVDNFVKMSNIIAPVNKYCNVMAKAGRGNEVPASAIYIAKYVNILIYQVMKLLSEGDAIKAKIIFLCSLRTMLKISINIFTCSTYSAKHFI